MLKTLEIGTNWKQHEECLYLVFRESSTHICEFEGDEEFTHKVHFMWDVEQLELPRGLKGKYKGIGKLIVRNDDEYFHDDYEEGFVAAFSEAMAYGCSINWDFQNLHTVFAAWLAGRRSAQGEQAK